MLAKFAGAAQPPAGPIMHKIPALQVVSREAACKGPPCTKALRVCACTAGTCNYACSSGLSCVYGVCTNALVGKRLLQLPHGQPDALALPAV